MKRTYIKFTIFTLLFCSCLFIPQAVFGDSTNTAQQILSAEIQQQASDLYDEAVELIKAENYLRAKEIFVELKSVYPDYKSSKKYLELVEEQLIEEASYQKRLQEFEARSSKDLVAESERKAQAGPLYEHALKLYKGKEFEAAKVKFEEVSLVYPSYKSTAYYLSQVDSEIELQRLKAIEIERKHQEYVLNAKIKKTYKEGLSLYKRKKYEFAKLRFEDVDQMSPGYKSVGKYLGLVNQKIIEEDVRLKKELKEAFEKQLAQEELKKRQAQDRETKKKADVLFNNAREFFNEKEYDLAQKKFEELNDVLRNYKDADKYIVKIEQALIDIEVERKAAEKLAFQREIDEEQNKIQWEGEQARKLKDIEDRTRVVEEIVEEEKLIAEGVPLDRSDLEQDKVLSPSALRAKEGYIVDLKQLITKSRKKIEQVNEKLEDQARRRRNQQREERARVYYEKAMRLFDDGKYDEARIFWEKAIRITEHEEMNNYVRDSVRRSKKQEATLRKEQNKQLKRLEKERGFSAKEVEHLYQSGVSLFKQNKYLASRTDFEEVEEMFPDHKATRSYLMLIEQNILRDQESLIRQKVQEKAATRQKDKEAWRKKIELQENGREAELKAQAEEVYKIALKYYKEKDWDKAKDKFKEVEWVLPNYKSTARYLRKLDKSSDDKKEKGGKLDFFKKLVKGDKKIENEEQAYFEKQKELKEQVADFRKKEESDFVYNGAVRLYKTHEYEKSLLKFKEVLKIDPQHRNAKSYIKKLEKNLGALKENYSAAQVKEKGKKVLKKAKSYYMKGVEAYKQHYYKKASENFKFVDRIYPGYKSTDKYLKVINRKLEEQGNELEMLYSSAVSLYKAKQYAKAKIKIEEVLAIDNSHMNANKYLVTLEKIEANDTKKRMIEEEKSAKDKRYKKAEKYYKGGLLAYKKKSYLKAKESFTRAEKAYPGFKNALKYLTIVEEKIEQEKEPSTGELKSFQAAIKKEKKEKIEKKKSDLEDLYRKALDLYKKEFYEEAKVGFLQLEKRDPSYKNTKKYLSIIENRIKEKRDVTLIKDEKLKDSYSDALKLYREKKYKDAERKFQEIEKVEPSYRSTKKYLNKLHVIANATPVAAVASIPVPKSSGFGVNSQIIDRAISQRQKELNAQAEILYERAVRYFTDKQFGEAKRSFIELEATYPGYKQVLDYLSHIDDDIARFNETQQRRKRSSKIDEKQMKRNAKRALEEGFHRDVEELYLQAVNFYKANEYDYALDKFDEVSRLMPDFKATNSYIKRINKKVIKEQKQKAKELARNKKIRLEQEKLIEMTRMKDAVVPEKPKEVVAPKITEKPKKDIQKEEKLVEPESPVENLDSLIESDKIRVAKLKGEKLIKDEAAREAYAQYLKVREAEVAAEAAARTLRLNREKMRKKVLIKSKKEKAREKKRIMKEAKKLRKIRQKEYSLNEHSIVNVTGGVVVDSGVADKGFKIDDTATQLKLSNSKQGLISELAKIDKEIEALTLKRKAKESENNKQQQKFEEEELRKRKKSELFNTKLSRSEDKKKAKARKRKQKIARKNEELLKKQYQENRKEIAEKLASAKKEEDVLWTRQIDALYQEAVALFESEKYGEAKIKFASIRALHPNYNSVDHYWRMLKMIEKGESFEDIDIIEPINEVDRDSDSQKTAIEKNDEIFEEAVELLDEKKLDLAAEKFDAFEKFLREEDVDAKYKKKMTKKLNAKRKSLEKEIKKRKAITKKREDGKKRLEKKQRLKESKDSESKMRSDSRLKEKKEKDLEALGQKIKVKEAELKKKNDALNNKNMVERKYALEPKVIEIKSSKKEVNVDADSGLDAFGEKNRREYLRKMISQRKKELEVERIEIVAEFNDNLESIYEKAVKTYGRGKFIDAKRLFLEIDTLSPGYKKVVYYINKINRKLRKIEASQKKKKARIVEHVVEPAAESNVESIFELNESVAVPVESIKSRSSIINDALNNVEDPIWN